MYKDLCRETGGECEPEVAYLRLVTDDAFAAGICRLGYWCDPHTLPLIGATELAWRAYMRVQRPGKPASGRWKTYAYPTACALFGKTALPG